MGSNEELIHKRRCRWCSGSGRVEVFKDGEYKFVDCSVCKGTGEIIVNVEKPI